MATSSYSGRNFQGNQINFRSEVYGSGPHIPGAVLLYDHNGSPVLVSSANPLPVSATLQASDAIVGRMKIDESVDLNLNSIPAPAAHLATITVKHDTVNAHQGLVPRPRHHAQINATTSGDNTIVSAVTDRAIQVINYAFLCADAVTVRWKSGASSNISGPMPFDASGGDSAGEAMLGHICTAPSEALVMNLSGNIVVGGRLTYVLLEL